MTALAHSSMIDSDAWLDENAWRLDVHTFAECASNGQWKPYRWLRWAGAILTDAIIAGGARIIIEAPPRVGKSDLVSHWLPIWFHDWWPERNIMLASYAAEISEDFGRKIKNDIEYNSHVRYRLRDDSKSVGRFNTNAGGALYALGVGGSARGRGFHLGIVDDTLKNNQQANSATERNKLWDWLRGTFFTRAEPGASIIVSAQRVHADDLSGRIRKEFGQEWDIIRLPALAEDNDPLGRKRGEPLMPERYTLDDLKAIRREVGEYDWLAQYQQSPLAVGSGAAYARFSDVNIDPAATLRAGAELNITLDWNINPGMHCHIGQYDGQTDEFVFVHEIHAPGMSVVGEIGDSNTVISALGRLFGTTIGRNWPRVNVFGDPTGKNRSPGRGESSLQLFVQGLKRMLPGVQVLVQMHPKPPVPMDRIMAMNEALCDAEGVRHMRIHPRCERLIFDLENNQLALDSEGHAVDVDKSDGARSHAGDSAGYMVHYKRPVGRVKSKHVARVNV